MSRKHFLLMLVLLTGVQAFAQSTIQYQVSFKNAVHHEAEVVIEFPSLDPGVLEVRMSRTSPGRYALHEFAKNVYRVKAVDEKGKSLEISRPNLHQWNVSGHQGYVKFSYTLYANRADGTYSGIDETHAHLNIPATLMYARGYEHRPAVVSFEVREDLNWKVATQLKSMGDNKFWAPDLHYLMDSPTELSNHVVKSFDVDGQTIRFVLHHDGDPEEMIDQYFERVKAIVHQEKAVYGELPSFDFGEYTFLACYARNADGDGMEHRNSTILTGSGGLRDGGFDDYIGTVSHEFFHTWNVERIRPASLEPFDYEEANMSGELWFAEGFTSYYTNLILCRAGIITPQQYIEGLTATMNYVWNSPGRKFFNPIEMSYQAPFVDAAKSIDPQNKNNTFISYYSYGSALGLALDLSLRNNDKNLDDFMKLVWATYGRKEIPYNVRDLQSLLETYAGEAFGREFFQKYIFDSQMPDYSSLFAEVGVTIEKAGEGQVDFGAYVSDRSGRIVIVSNPNIGSSAYNGGLENGDVIQKLNGQLVTSKNEFYRLLGQLKAGDEVTVEFARYGQNDVTTFSLTQDNSFKILRYEEAGLKLKKGIQEKRNSWVGKK